jgi:hypothetical protein
MVDYDSHADAVRQRATRLCSDWSSIPTPRRRVRLTVGRWLIAAGRRLSSEPGSNLAREALPR